MSASFFSKIRILSWRHTPFYLFSCCCCSASFVANSSQVRTFFLPHTYTHEGRNIKAKDEGVAGLSPISPCSLRLFFVFFFFCSVFLSWVPQQSTACGQILNKSKQTKRNALQSCQLTPITRPRPQSRLPGSSAESCHAAVAVFCLAGETRKRQNIRKFKCKLPDKTDEQSVAWRDVA